MRHQNRMEWIIICFCYGFLFSGISWPDDLNVFLKILNVSGQKKWILNELFSLLPSSLLWLLVFTKLSWNGSSVTTRTSVVCELIWIKWPQKCQSSFLCGVTGFYTFRKTRKNTNVTFLHINHLIYDNRGENFGCVDFVFIKLTQYSPAYCSKLTSKSVIIRNGTWTHKLIRGFCPRLETCVVFLVRP